jgi:abortive infection bacteriophage resistance protein
MVAGSEEGKITEEQLDWMNKSEKYILVTTKVTNMEYLFHSSQFNGNISHWDVSNVKNMIGVFYNSQFNGDISHWNFSNVENM